MFPVVFQGNQSLGISLLIGIIMLYATAYFFIFDATDLVRVRETSIYKNKE